MTPASLVAVAQSSRDKRLPSITSMRVAAVRSSLSAWTLRDGLDGLTRQRRLANPRSRRVRTSVEPIKPVAPVMRIRSLVSIIKPPIRGILCRTGSICNKLTLYRLQAYAGQELSQVIEEPD